MTSDERNPFNSFNSFNLFNLFNFTLYTPRMPDFRPSFLQGLALGSAFRLALPREAMRGLGGARAGAAAGSSLDFLDFREYHPGDDLRRLDWSVYARTDREVVKLYREEVFPRLDIVLDASRSMDLPGTAKASSALALCGALAAAAANAGCAAALWTAGFFAQEDAVSPTRPGERMVAAPAAAAVFRKERRFIGC